MPLFLKVAFTLTALFLLALPPSLSSARTDAPQNCESRPFDQGRLWKVSREGSPPSYIFGTMHSKDPRILQLPGIIMQAFNASTIAVFETSLKDEDITKSQAMMLLARDQSLKSKIGPARFTALAKMAAPYGMTPEVLDRVKIWAAAALISQPPPSRQGAAPHMNLLDKELEKSARQSRKQIIALETNLEQLGIFDQVPEAVQLEYLDQSMIENQTIDEELETITSYYLSGNTGWIACNLEETLKTASAGLNRLMTDKLINERNRRMVDRMSAALQKGNAFVGVGALHLPGDAGILSLLQARGFKVERKY